MFVQVQVQASSVWDRLSQPKKSRLHEALEAASGTKSSPELERVHCDPCPPGHGENVPIANQEFIQVESADQPAQQQAKSSLRMKLRSAVRLTLSMTRFKTRVEELQVLCPSDIIASSMPLLFETSISSLFSRPLTISYSLTMYFRPFVIIHVQICTRRRYPQHDKRLMLGSTGMVRPTM